MSSFATVGSLLETPYPLSPGTSPEPTSPATPVVSPGTIYPISAMDLSQTDAGVDSRIANTESVASITGSPVDSTTLTLTSDASPPGTTCIAGTTDSLLSNTNFTSERFTSSTDPNFSRGLTLFAESQDSTLNTSIASTTEPRTLTTGPVATGAGSTYSTGPITSTQEHITSISGPARFSASYNTGPIQCTSPLECLEMLAHKGDDTYFPQYLHQVICLFYLRQMSDTIRNNSCIQTVVFVLL